MTFGASGPYRQRSQTPNPDPNEPAPPEPTTPDSPDPPLPTYEDPPPINPVARRTLTAEGLYADVRESRKR